MIHNALLLIVGATLALALRWGWDKWWWWNYLESRRAKSLEAQFFATARDKMGGNGLSPEVLDRLPNSYEGDEFIS